MSMPSEWVQRWSHLVPPASTVLDVACGSGRHVQWFADRGCLVTGIDRDATAMRPLKDIAELIVADIEADPWPLGARSFDAVVVVNYLWRPRLPDVIACVGEGGVLIYETFAVGNETIGKPSNPDFLLLPGELLEATQGLRVVAFEDGFEAESETLPPRFVQRIVAVRKTGAKALRQHLLSNPESAFAGRVKSVDSEDLA
jgi:SAM-dependent methyltransferase